LLCTVMFSQIGILPLINVLIKWWQSLTPVLKFSDLKQDLLLLVSITSTNDGLVFLETSLLLDNICQIKNITQIIKCHHLCQTIYLPNTWVHYWIKVSNTMKI
jgi:hypothetical protein